MLRRLNSFFKYKLNITQRTFCESSQKHHKYNRVSDRLMSDDKNYKKFLTKKSANVKLDNIETVYAEKFTWEEFEIYKTFGYDEYTINLLKSFMEGFGAQKIEKDDFKKIIYTISRIPAEKLPTKHVLRLTKLVGSSIVRKMNLLPAQHNFNNFLKILLTRDELKDYFIVKSNWFPNKSKSSFISLSLQEIESMEKFDKEMLQRILDGTDPYWSDLVDIMMAATNLNYYSFELYESQKGIFMKCLTIDQEKIEGTMFARLLSFYWSFRKFGIVDHDFTDYILKFHLESIKTDIITKNLRFLWLACCYEVESVSVIKKAFSIFFDKTANMNTFTYNQKNAQEICQMFNKIFPKSIARYDKALNSNDNSTIAFMNTKDYQDHKDLYDNPFVEYFHDVFKMYVTSFWLNNTNSRTNKSLATHTTYIESNPRKNNNQNMIIMKQPLYITLSSWENHIATIQDDLNVKYVRNVKVGYQEVDFIINDDLIFEINGRPHVMFHDQDIMTDSSILKKKSLECFGYYKFAILAPRDWKSAEGDYKKEKDLISKLLKYALISENSSDI